jgi:hypothetical protein
MRVSLPAPICSVNLSVEGRAASGRLTLRCNPRQSLGFVESLAALYAFIVTAFIVDVQRGASSPAAPAAAELRT